MFRSRMAVLALAAAVAVGLAPGPMPALGQPVAPAPQKPTEPAADPFGEEVTLEAKNIIYFKGTGNWDSAFETIVDAFKTVNALSGQARYQADRFADDDLYVDRR